MTKVWAADYGVTATTTTVEIRKVTGCEKSTDKVAQEVPIALVYNGISHAVMMATPANLEEFALGFSVTEGIVSNPGELYGVDIQPNQHGISVEIQVASRCLAILKQQQRNATGRTGCGICGKESLALVLGQMKSVVAPQLDDNAIQAAVAAFPFHQPLLQLTGATHAAAWCSLDGNIISVREDVGRHNALDKLIGMLLRQQANLQQGFVLISSRASYEIVQKSIMAGVGAVVAVSAATSLAVDRAQHAGMLLVGFVRPGRHLIYAHPGMANKFE